MATPSACRLFDTPIGTCALVWSEDGVVAFYLPDQDDATLRRRLRQRFGVEAVASGPDWVERAIERIVALLNGGTDDLADLPLDWSGIPDFHRRVYELARTVPPGRTTTYGELARTLGDAGAARAVGQALGRNRFAVVVPCHRVLAAGGGSGGFSAPGGLDTKFRLLEIEGASPGADANQPSLF
jgi:methylated-DNA-[protein]-cysteine S-methyltransferase